MHSVYSIATTRPASFATDEEVRREVAAYLYDHTIIVGTIIGRVTTAFVLRTDAPDVNRATHLALYQTERLRSGLIGACVLDSFDEAIDTAIRLTDGGVRS